ncbi:sulfite exporter TauE/SafE family protein [Photobacterium sanguinicancri]|uniref:sulfite exporter TauE/SafE family protein n=1 Tax=Photobacterium sanguinicancri TaxID=875932 RepID=UPI000788FC70|nr:sulfite exporter TauE/SafE family protein [Photobacterium sanguinicancri]KXI23762.1 permease [Photobacterium sanguinicancri]
MDTSLLLALTMIFIGSFVQSSIGFGLAIITAPILFQISPDYVPAPITLTALFLSLVNAYKFKANISLDGLWMAFIGRIPGSIAGGALLYFVEPKVLSLWIGGIVILAVIISLLPIRIQPNSTRLAIAGFFSGLFGTSSGIGGPPMALLLQHQEANLIRANLSAFFVVSSLLSLIVQVPVGHMSLHHLYLSLPFIPASYLGYKCAMVYVDKIDKQTIRTISLVMCSLSGAAAIYSAL